jgi:hypothetical protein
MRHRALLVSLSAVVALLVGCSKSDFPTQPSPVADTPLTTLAALKVDGNASLPGGGQTPFNMTLIARSLNSTAPGAQAQTPGTTEVSGNFVLGTGVKGTVTGSVQGSLENGTLLGTLTSSAEACARQYNGPISTAGLAWSASDSTGGCPLPITVQASRADAPTTCTYTISPVGSVSGGGGTTVINIATGPTCTWVVEAQAPWVRITSPTTGVGPGTVTLVIDPSEVPRQGTVLVAGQSLSIDQTPACTVAVAPQALSFTDAGGTSSLTITTPASCDWRIESAPAWVTASPASGRGTTTATLVAEPNSGAERQGSVRVSGQTVTVTQAGPSGGPAPCLEGVTLSASTFPGTGGTGTIDIAASGTCAWTAETDVPWIVITGGSGTGAGRVTFTVQQNPNFEAGRTGTIRVGGRVLTITQGLLPPCHFQLSASPNAFPATGGTGTVSVTVEAHCAWTAASSVSWIVIAPPGSGSGNGQVSFSVLPNTGAARGPGTITIGMQTVTVTQGAATVLTGQITNAINNQPVLGATVSVGPVSAVTNGGGTYTLVNPASGQQPVQVSAPTFASRTEMVNIVAGSTTTFNTALVPLRADITIVLTWATQPPDLDEHLIGPRAEGGMFEVFYDDMQPVPYASLDVDDQDGSGPETITIGRVNGNFVPGTYTFFIDNFSLKPGFDVSNAVVVIFQGDIEIGRFPVSGASGDPSFRVWEVFTMVLSGTPTGQPQITPIQRFSQPVGLRSLQRTKR